MITRLCEGNIFDANCVSARVSKPRRVDDTALHGFADRFISRFAHNRVNIQTLPFSSPQIAMIGVIRLNIEKPL